MELDEPPARASSAESPQADGIAVGKTNPKCLGCSRLFVGDQPNAEVDRLQFIGIGLRHAADVAHVRRDLEVSGNRDAAHVVRRGLEEPAVVDVVDVSPERAILASTVGAEVAIRSLVRHDEPAGADEVARRQLSADRRVCDDEPNGRDNRDHERPSYFPHSTFLLEAPDDPGAFVLQSC